MLILGNMKIPKNIPSTIGIYLFLQDRVPIYIGKAVNLKARVRSHFEAAKLDTKEAAITLGADKIKIIKTPTEFQALVLESQLIQKHHPKYNVRWKDDKSYLYIKVEGVVKIVRKRDVHERNVFGPFASTREAENILRQIRRVVPFHSSDNIKRPCFYSKIGLCESCPTSDKNIRKIVKILSGKVELVLRDLRKDMKRLSSGQEYEQALVLRERITAFERLIKQQLDTRTYADLTRKNAEESLINLLKLKRLKRIECYDISNLSQKEATASMVVWQNGHIDKSQYRKFKIKNLKSRSDFEMLDEVLRRRMRNKWRRPDLLVVDGGKPQVRVFMKVTKIPVVGIAKNPDRLVLGKQTLRLPLTNPGFNLIRLLRDESHRFAKKYHLGLRGKNYFS